MLLQRIASGDSTAVAACLEQYANLVWSAAVRWSATRADAEDAVQEIFIDLWKSAARFDPAVASEATFVMMIARRRLIDRRRRSEKQPATTALDGEVTVPLSPSGHDPQQQAERSEEVALATQLLADLRDEERQILELSVRDGLSHQEISTRTGVPLGSVKTHLRRGLQRLRERWTRSSTAAARGSV